MEYNHPDLWRSVFPKKIGEHHKYDHGHAVIYGAPKLTGATRLAAEACARMGTGLVTVLSSPETAAIYRTSLPSHILVRDDINWSDEKVTAKLYGSGGLSITPDYMSVLPTILDADALKNLPSILSENYILTPHEGEFIKAFPDLKGTRSEKALAAAKNINAHIVLKGAETIIVAPDGRILLNDHASPYLATAGTGDVLAGMITGLLAQKMPIFEACAAAVWLHGEASLQIGAGLVASDLPDKLLEILPTS